jgi:hypothetical protein
MTEQDKLIRDIETLRESIKINREEIARPGITQAERVAIIRHGAWCMQELAGLIAALSAIDTET